VDSKLLNLHPLGQQPISTTSRHPCQCGGGLLQRPFYHTSLLRGCFCSSSFPNSTTYVFILISSFFPYRPFMNAHPPSNKDPIIDAPPLPPFAYPHLLHTHTNIYMVVLNMDHVVLLLYSHLHLVLLSHMVLVPL
jgi:hypothetical protein